MSEGLFLDGSWEQAAARVIVKHELYAPYGHPTPYKEMFERGDLYGIARRAWGELNEAEQQWGTLEQIDLLARKQHDYGHQNISKFGEHGLMVRLWDKIARYENLARRQVGPENESLVDTLKDMIGYVVLWGMVRQGTFTLPLERDMIGADR